jgi:hypothetical protein
MPLRDFVFNKINGVISYNAVPGGDDSLDLLLAELNAV